MQAGLITQELTDRYSAVWNIILVTNHPLISELVIEN
jgi:hypothetical protein